MLDSPGHSKALYGQLYRTLRLIRRSQELLMAEYHPADEMRCPIHFCLGQEATPAALSVILRRSDVLMSHHRSHGYYLAKGSPISAMIAEFYGKQTGANGGLAGSQELSCGDARFYSGTILSGMFAMANGAAFSQKYSGTDDITVAIIGDGGMEEGIVYEVLNLAALKKLPVLFICENNLYSAHTRIDLRTVSHSLAGRVAPFGVRTLTLDGNDPMLLHQSFSKIVGQIRSSAGPVFAEVLTYRICGHVGPENDDVIGYRPPEELEKWKMRDACSIMREAMRLAEYSEGEIEKIEREVDAEIHAAIASAKQAPFPDFSAALTLNVSGSYDPVIARFSVKGVSAFDGAQAETRLAPY